MLPRPITQESSPKGLGLQIKKACVKITVNVFGLQVRWRASFPNGDDPGRYETWGFMGIWGCFLPDFLIPSQIFKCACLCSAFSFPLSPCLVFYIDFELAFYFRQLVANDLELCSFRYDLKKVNQSLWDRFSFGASCLTPTAESNENHVCVPIWQIMIVSPFLLPFVQGGNDLSLPKVLQTMAVLRDRHKHSSRITSWPLSPLHSHTRCIHQFILNFFYLFRNNKIRHNI